jgi:hypothetical protein
VRRKLVPVGLERNDSCYYGSGKKYKRCHLDIDAAARGEGGPSLRSWEMDFDTGTGCVEFEDGNVVSGPLASGPRSGMAVRRSRFAFGARLLTLTLDDGEQLEVEIGKTGERPAVPVVYLDQLHWVTLAQQLRSPDRVRPAERKAAEAMLTLARARQIVLPIAGAHLTEMAGIGGHRRRDLAATMLGLCRGWQMRNPVRVRGDEYASALVGQAPVVGDVFTLEPGELFVDGSERPQAPADFPPDVADIFTRLVAVSSVYSAALDGERLDMRVGRDAAARWAADFPPLARYMRDQRIGEEHARMNAYGRFISDQQLELARCATASGVGPSTFSAWLDQVLPNQLCGMPYVGRLAEVLYLRLRNADDKWEANDLNDMNFLCCAAGYADVLVGEKKTTEYLRRAEPRVRPGAHVCHNLTQAVAYLHHLHDRDAEPR